MSLSALEKVIIENAERHLSDIRPEGLSSDYFNEPAYTSLCALTMLELYSDHVLSFCARRKLDEIQKKASQMLPPVKVTRPLGSATY
jgi:hypothetical protein